MTNAVDLSPTDKAKVRDASRYMALRGAPSSDAGRAFVCELYQSLFVPGTGGTGRPTTQAKQEAALGATVVDLLASAAEGGWGRRSLSNDSFAGHPVSRRMFTRVVEALDGAGLIVWFKGFWFREYSEFARAETGQGAPSCFRATAGLLALAEAHGITLGNWADHFAMRRPQMPTGKAVLEVRASSTKDAEGRRQQGRTLPIDPADQRASAIAERVECLNAYLATKRIDGLSFPGLRRIFSGGDLPGFDWNMGGRFYSVRHAEAYEQWKGGCDTRLGRISLDGEPAAEVDISACHLTLLYGLLGRPMELDTDPYSIEGHPRDRVKRWLTFALGRGSSAPCRNWYSRVREAVLEKHPMLLELETCGVSTLALQFHESEVLLRAMERLRDEHDVPTLPIHDGLIVPSSKVAQVTEVLSSSFMDYLEETRGDTYSTIPRLKVNYRP